MTDIFGPGDHSPGRRAPSAVRLGHEDVRASEKPGHAPVSRLWFAVLFGYLSLGAALQVLPAYTERRFAAGPATVGLVIGLPSLAAAALRPVAGWLADTGRARTSVLAAGGLGILAGLGQRWSPDLVELLLARLVVGASEGALFVAAVSWVLQVTEPSRRGRVAGWFGLSMWGGLALGPAVAVLAEQFGGVPVAWAAIVAMPATGLLLSLTTRTGPRAPTFQTRAVRNLLPKAARRPGVVLGLASYGYGTVAGLLLLRLSHGYLGLDQLALTLFAVAFLLTRAAGSPLGDRYGGAQVATISSLVEAVGLCLIALAPDTATAVIGIALSGAGVALIYPAVVSVAIKRSSSAANGAAVGAMTSCWDLAITVAAPLGGLVARELGYAASFLLATVVVAGAAALALTTTDERRPIAGP